MKKVLSVILVIIMMALFTACGSGSSGSGGAAPAQSASAPSKSEESPDVIPGTKLAMPDKETDVASKKTEIIETTDNPDYDLQINVYYESAEEASTAYYDYYYRMQQIHNYKDSDGNRIVFTFLPDKLETEPADNYTFYVKYAVPEEEVESLPIQDFAGKYLCVEMTSDGKDMTDFVKSAWADKSFYEYIVIAEDGKLTLYAYQGGTTNELSNVDIKAITQDSVIFASGETWKIEDGKIIAEASNSKMVFERNDDIPES